MKTIIYLLALLLMASCSMQKRKYTNGWDIQWRHSVKSVKSSNGADTEKLISEDTIRLIKADNSEIFTEKPILIKEKINQPIVPMDSSETTEAKNQSSDQKTAVNKKTHRPIKDKAAVWTKKKISSITKKDIKFGKKMNAQSKNPMKMIGTATGILIVIFAVIFIILLVVFIAFIRLLNELFWFL